MIKLLFRILNFEKFTNFTSFLGYLADYFQKFCSSENLDSVMKFIV